jgi:hypothetical protein
LTGPPKDSQPISPLVDTLNALNEKATDEQSMERVSPNVPQAVVALAQLGQLVRIRRALEHEQSGANILGEMVRIRRALERQQFKGNVREVTLACTAQRQELLPTNYPFLPEAITVVFFNDGPDTAYISINDANLLFTVRVSESHPIDFSKADQRIDSLYYWCDSGNSASVRLVLKY